MGLSFRNLSFWYNERGQQTRLKLTRIADLREPLMGQVVAGPMSPREAMTICTNIAHSLQFIEFLNQFKSEDIMTRALLQQFHRALVIMGMSLVEALMYLVLRNKGIEFKQTAGLADLMTTYQKTQSLSSSLWDLGKLTSTTPHAQPHPYAQDRGSA